MSRSLFMLTTKYSLFYEHIWTIREFPCDFLSAGMKSAGRIHPQKRFFVGGDKISGEDLSPEEFFVRRDEISGKNSSPEEIFYPQG